MTSGRAALIAIATSVLLAGCQSAPDHRRAVEDTSGERVTAGTVQREIRVGMSGAEVAQVLGSPNIVTTDEHRREVWVYDKISTTNVYSASSGGGSANASGGRLFLGVPALIFGSAGLHGNSTAGASTTTQKTFTVVIKFDEQSRVHDFAYHTTQF